MYHLLVVHQRCLCISLPSLRVMKFNLSLSSLVKCSYSDFTQKRLLDRCPLPYSSIYHYPRWVMKFNLADNSYHWSLMIGSSITLNCITQSSLHTLYNVLLWFKQRSYSNGKELHKGLSPIHFSYALDMPPFKASHQFQLIHVLYSLATHQCGLTDLLYFWQFVSNAQFKGNSSLSSWKKVE
jgi:hypothetical protein